MLAFAVLQLVKKSWFVDSELQATLGRLSCTSDLADCSVRWVRERCQFPRPTAPPTQVVPANPDVRDEPPTQVVPATPDVPSQSLQWVVVILHPFGSAGPAFIRAFQVYMET